MITFYVYGLDQFVVGDYSRDHSENLANLYEVSEDYLNFYAPSGIVFHKGIEQTSWNVIVKVTAPKKYKVFEKSVADYVFKTLSLFAIHISAEFEYFEEDSRYEKVNSKFPRFIEPDHIHQEFEEDDDDFEWEEVEEEHHHHHHDEDCDCHHHHHEEDEEIDINNEEEIFLGNAFEGFEEKLEAKEKELKK